MTNWDLVDCCTGRSVGFFAAEMRRVSPDRLIFFNDVRRLAHESASVYGLVVEIDRRHHMAGRRAASWV
jgi:hypothetical protein